jgi:hypothetical protein
MNSIVSRRLSRSALGLPRIGGPSALIVLLLVLIVHAALVLGEAIEGPRWLALLECMAALLIGLKGLRELASQHESQSASASFDPVAVPMARLASLSAEQPAPLGSVDAPQGVRS